MSADWEELLENEESQPVHDALRAGTILAKFWRTAEERSKIFICPTPIEMSKRTGANLRVLEFYSHLG